MKRTLKVTNIKRKRTHGFRERMSSKQEDLFFQRRSKGKKISGCIVLMSSDLGLRKKIGSKNHKKMFEWKRTVVCDGVFVFQKESAKKESAILITIPKAV